jgi:hypothetical protein
MSSEADRATAGALHDSYNATFGAVPRSIDDRLRVLEVVDRRHTVEVIDALGMEIAAEILDSNPQLATDS